MSSEYVHSKLDEIAHLCIRFDLSVHTQAQTKRRETTSIKPRTFDRIWNEGREQLFSLFSSRGARRWSDRYSNLPLFRHPGLHNSRVRDLSCRKVALRLTLFRLGARAPGPRRSILPARSPHLRAS